MTQRESLTGQAVSRRAALGVLGVVPLAASGVLAAAGTAHASDSSRSGQIPADLRPGGALDQLAAQLAAEDKFSGTILLVHKDKPVLSRSYGMANKQLSIPNRPDTIFALASVGKLFTSVAVAQLAQRGMVAFHETLGTYLDGFSADVANTVTVHQLLTHTSGMGDYNRSGAYWAEAITWSSAEEVMDGTLAFIRTSTLDFTPGTGHGYSNSGYHVLGAIVAKASGQTYYDYVREHIFRVAGMTGADFYTTPQWRDDRRIAHPYSKNTTQPPTEERLDAIDRQLFIGGPGGGCLSNATDLVRFTKALLGNKLLNPAFTQLTLSPKAPVEPLPPRPGSAAQIPFETYAPLAVIVNNRWAVGHTGGTTDGVSTNLEWYPDSDWVVVTLSNYDAGTTRPIDSLARNLISQQ